MAKLERGWPPILLVALRIWTEINSPKHLNGPLPYTSVSTLLCAQRYKANAHRLVPRCTFARKRTDGSASLGRKCPDDLTDRAQNRYGTVKNPCRKLVSWLANVGRGFLNVDQKPHTMVCLVKRRMANHCLNQCTATLRHQTPGLPAVRKTQNGPPGRWPSANPRNFRTGRRTWRSKLLFQRATWHHGA